LIAPSQIGAFYDLVNHMRKIAKAVGIILIVIVAVLVALTIAEYYTFDKAANSPPRTIEVKKEKNL
jgi:hypothetical protein